MSNCVPRSSNLYRIKAACTCSITQSCPTHCDPMDCSTPGLSVLHHLPEFAQVHVHCINDAVKPSHLLTPSSPSALKLSPHHEKKKKKPAHRIVNSKSGCLLFPHRFTQEIYQICKIRAIRKKFCL